MDQNREIRLVIPPFFFLLIFLLNAYCAGRVDLANSPPWNLIAAAAATIPLGFAISVISTVSLWFCFGDKYEAKVRISNLDGLRWILLNSVKRNADDVLPNLEDELNEGRMLYGVATFDHGVLPEALNKWLVRRWNSFNVSVHTIWAIVLGQSISLALFCSELSSKFVGLSIGLSVGFGFILICHAWRAWRHTMEMLDFQVLLRSPPRPSAPAIADS